MRNAVPDIRIAALNSAPVRARGDFVLYWMLNFHRTHSNFALDRAIERSRELRKPLVVVETLPSGLKWDCERFHKFAVDGMRHVQEALVRTGIEYCPCVETKRGRIERFIAALSRRAALVVTDDFPCGQYPAVASRVARESSVLVEAVDSNGILPLRATERVFPTAYAFRRFLQRELRVHLAEAPARNPLRGLRLARLPVPPREFNAWRGQFEALERSGARALSRLAIDHAVAPVGAPGGMNAASRVLRRFIKQRLHRYADERNHPDADATSGLATYLHWGHISAHEVVAAVLDEGRWTPARLRKRADGRKEGWWGAGGNAEAFLDQVVTWRELGFNMSSKRDDSRRYESLPFWARDTLERHARDPRPYVYECGDFEAARTHDALWNAAQTQLVREGRMHNYLRMLWGKKILEWSPTPQAALDVMVELNNKYSLDGRDPNSYSGIFWVLGRYDRPWPERPVFGKVRYMSSDNTKRKVRLREYLKRYTPAP